MSVSSIVECQIYIQFVEALITYEVMILFSRLEKAKKNNKCISQRLKDLKKRTNRGLEILKVKVFACMNYCRGKRVGTLLL